MCDCFHMVLPTWQGAPGSESGRRLQPEADAETEEEHSVTEGLVNETIRPRPQGSSPVYECATEGAGFGVQEEAQGRRAPLGRRRSWWKRDSGDSRTLSRMSHPETLRAPSLQETTEVTLKTEVEVGASGYSITGGGDQGIFVKQVLKDSSAANLFREGDQLLSTTIFFDNMKYEDALKILQYSEPYKVQFRIRRKLPNRENEQGTSEDPKKQDEEVTEGPTKVPEGGGDQDRLLPRPREGRSRRPQDRFSWPKFPAMGPKYRAGPRRSHSSSEAYERGSPAMSPTSTDTEAQHPEDEQKLSSQQKRRILSLRFRTRSGRMGKGARGGPASGVREEAAPQKTVTTLSTEHSVGTGGPREVAGPTPTRRKKTKEVRVLEEEPWPRDPCGDLAREDGGDVVQGLEVGIAKLSLQDTTTASSMQSTSPEIRVRIPRLQTPRFGVSKQKAEETDVLEAPWEQRPEKLSEEGPGADLHGLRKGDSLPAGEQEGKRPHAEEKEEGSEGKLNMPKFKVPFEWSPSKEVKTVKVKPPREATVEARRPRTETGQEGHTADEKERPPVHTEVMGVEGAIQLSEGKLSRPDGGDTRKGLQIKFQRPSIKKTKVDLKPSQVERKDPKVDLQTPKVDINLHSIGRALPEVEVGTTAPGLSMEAMKGEGDSKLGDRDSKSKDGKFKMPSFKMPSFGVSVPSKAMEASVDMSLPLAQRVGEVSVPSLEGEVKPGDLSVQLPSTDVEVKGREVGVKLPEGPLPEGDLSGQAVGIGLKGHLPKFQMPGVKIPKVDIKAPKVDSKDLQAEITTSDVDEFLPNMEVAIQAPSTKVEGVLSMGDKNLASKDSQFKMPKLKMPSFDVPAPRKSTKASVDTSLPKAKTKDSVPSLEGQIKIGDVDIPAPFSGTEMQSEEVVVKLPEVQSPKGELSGPDIDIGFKEHLPKFLMPSIKMGKIDLTAPQEDLEVDLNTSKEDVSLPDVDVSLSGVEVGTSVTRISMEAVKGEGDITPGDKDLKRKDGGKFKMPSFKMTSFGMSAPSKSMETSVDMSLPKTKLDVSVPSIEGEVEPGDHSIQLSSANMEVKGGEVSVKLPEGQLPEGELSGSDVETRSTGPTFQRTGVNIPKVDIKAPKVNIKGLKVDMKGPKVDRKDFKEQVVTPDVDLSLPSMEVDIQASDTLTEDNLSLGDQDLAFKESKFKMLKIKMPSFGMSTPSESIKASMEESVPESQVEASVLTMERDVKISDLSIQLASVHTEVKGIKVDVKLPEDQLYVGKLSGSDIGVAPKGHPPTFEMVIAKMPKGDLKGPEVDIKSPDDDLKVPMVDLRDPKVDLRDIKEGVATPDMDMSLTNVGVALQTMGVKMEGGLSMGDNDLDSKDSKLKMPKFKMPSFGVSAPSKSMEASVAVSPPEVQVEVSVPSLEGEVKPGELSIQPPSTDVEVKGGEVSVKLLEGQLPKGEVSGPDVVTRSKGHLPKFQMPGVKMPKVDIKDPKVNMKDPKVDKKDPKEYQKYFKGKLTTSAVDLSLPSMEMDNQALSTKVERTLSMGEKDLAFKGSKCKMPSFDVSAQMESINVPVEAPLAEAKVEASVPTIEGSVKTSNRTIQLPSAHTEVKSVKVGVKLSEGHLTEGELSGPDHGEGEHSGPDVGASPKGHLPKFQMTSIKKPKVDLKASEVDTKSPKVGFKTIKVDTSLPDVDISLPEVHAGITTPGLSMKGMKGEEDSSLGGKDFKSKDGKFKMPQVKMPPFDMSASSNSMEASVEISLPKTQVEVLCPSMEGEVMLCDISIQQPSTNVEVKGEEGGMKLLEGQLPEIELSGQDVVTTTKGQLPRFQMPGVKIPKVDTETPKVDIKGTKEDMKCPKVDMKDIRGEMTTTEVDLTLTSRELDIQTPSMLVKGDLFPGDQDLTFKESKFKIPKFKMSSFGVSAPSKSIETSVETHLPEPKEKASVPTMEEDVNICPPSIQLPSVHREVKSMEGSMELPQGHLSGLEVDNVPKGHLLKFQMPSVKMPKMDLKNSQDDIKGPTVDLKSPELDLKDLKDKTATTDMVPSLWVGIHTLGVKVEGDVPVGEKDFATKDSKFKMPSFGVSAPSKSIKESVEVSMPEAQVEVSVSPTEGEVKPCDLSIQLPSTDVEVKVREVGMKLLEGQLPEGEVSKPDVVTRSKEKLPKSQMPEIMPKVDIKASNVDIKGPKVDIKGPSMDMKDFKGNITIPEVDLSLTSMEEDSQAVSVKVEEALSLGDKDLASKDSKFKMPKFKMPSFVLSVPSKSIKASEEVSLPESQVDASVPTMEGDVKTSDMSIQLTSEHTAVKGVEVGMKLPDVHFSDVGDAPKWHLPKFQIPSVKVPQLDLKASQMNIKGPDIDLKAPKVDLRGPKVDVKDLKGEVATPDMEMSMPHMEMDIQNLEIKIEDDLSGGDKALTAKDSKFKMPSFGVSVPSKSMEASVEVSLPERQVVVSVPSMEEEVKACDHNIRLRSTDVEMKDGEVEVKLLEGQLPERELSGPDVVTRSRGQLPKFQMPGVKTPNVDIKTPKLDIKAPQVEIKDLKVDMKGLKLDMKGLKGEVTTHKGNISLSRMEMDIQTPSDKLERGSSLGDKDLASRDSKFKTPSFNMSAPSKSIKGSAEVSLPEREVEASVSTMEGEVKSGNLSIKLPSVHREVKGVNMGMKLPEGQLPEVELSELDVRDAPKELQPKFQMTPVKMPKVDFKLPHVDIKDPKVDMKDLNGEVATPDRDMSLSCIGMDIQTLGVKVEGDLCLRDKDLATKDIKFKMPPFGMPALSKSTEASVEISVPESQVEASLPTMEGEVKSGDLSIQRPSVHTEMKGVELGMKLSESSLSEGKLPGPDVCDTLEGQHRKYQMPSVKMPTMDLKTPNMDIKGPKVDMKKPKLDISILDVDTSLPKAETDTDLKIKDSKFKMPKLKMSSFGTSAPSKFTEASTEVFLSEAQVEVSVSSMEEEIKSCDLSIQLPSTDVDVKGGEVNAKLLEGQLPEKELSGPCVVTRPTGQLPTFQMPEVKMPKVDFKASKTEINDTKSVPSLEGGIEPGYHSIQVPSADLEVEGEEVGVKLPEGPLSEGDLLGQAVGIGLKGHLPKFQMPGVKIPKVDIKAPKGDMKGPKVDMKSLKQEVASPDMDLPLSRVEVDSKAPEAKVESDVSLRDKDLASKDGKFKMPKFKVPSLGLSVPNKPRRVSVDMSLRNTQVEEPVSSMEEEAQPADLSIQRSSLDVQVKCGEVDVKLPEGQPLSDSDRSTPGLQGHLPKFQMPSVTMLKADLKAPGEEPGASGAQFSRIPKVGSLAVPSDTQDCQPSPVESSHLSIRDGVALTKDLVTIPVATRLAECPEDTTLVLHTDAPCPSLQGAAEMQPRAPEQHMDVAPSPVAFLASATYARVTFPKFYKPKFGVSVVTPSAAEDEDMDTAALRTGTSLPPSTALLSGGTLVSEGLEGHSEPDVTMASKDSEQTRKGSPFKTARFKLPSLSRSPKKGVGQQRGPEGEVELSLGLDPTPPSMQTGCYVLTAEGEAKLPLETEGVKGQTEKSSLATPTFQLSKGTGRPQAEAQGSLSWSSAAAGRNSNDGGEAREAPKAKVTGSRSETSLPEHDSFHSEGHGVHGPLGSSVLPTPREGTVPPKEEMPPSAGVPLDSEAPLVQSPGGTGQVTGVRAGSQDGWFRVPRFRMSGFWRTATKDKDGAASAMAPGPGPQGEDKAAGVQGQDSYESRVEVATTPQLTDTEADGPAETRSQDDVLECSVHGPGLGLSPPVGAAMLKEARVRPGEGSLLLQSLSAHQAAPGQSDKPGPPEPGDHREGPVKLRTAQTETPARVSIVQTEQLWEDSVVTVTFPRLKGPRFAFRAPSTDADVFVPSVREVPCQGAGSGGPMGRDSTDAWVASILQPTDTGQSPAMTSLSKVRVHIQGTQVASQVVTVCGGVPLGPGESSPPEAFSTQIVRESQVPSSEVQTPTYGFSLLKVKIPEPPTQTLGHTATFGSQSEDRPTEVPQQEASGADPTSADLQLDGEPFEIISASVSTPTAPGSPHTNSCSDEEPPEILELEVPSKDGQEEADQPGGDGGHEPRPASKKPAGLFRFWLPNIGLSSSGEETSSSDSKAQVLGPSPIQTQPEARPEAELPRKPDKGGWFRFPKLGFSSSPTKKTKRTEDGAVPEEQRLQEETAIFFDACESLSPEVKDAELAGAVHAGQAPEEGP
ncbi:PREDICTED: protein AHNAK2 [Elephantulus edwardii]|uniref:protein AHNAK2 n=1 Tax=Elephantulus edwardii TaxID=28737 RepID=UPI0003F0DA4F|nr:PREDICTED: protein AHNAK2 [Elephantulus edwardii]